MLCDLFIYQASDAIRQPKVPDLPGVSTPGNKENLGRDIATRVRTPVESPADNFDRTNTDGDNVSIDWASGDVSRTY